MQASNEPTTPDYQGYASFWDAPEPTSLPAHADGADAYTAFHVAADL